MKTTTLSLAFLFFCFASAFSQLQNEKFQHIYGDLSDVDSYGETFFAACGEFGVVMVSRDGGDTWKQPYTGTDASLFGIKCIDVNTAIAVGEYGVAVRSTDRGETWTVDTIAPSQTLLSIAFSNDIVIAATIGGEIYRSLDKGVSWTKTYQAQTGLNAVYPAVDRNWVAGGRTGALFFSSDDGITWLPAQTDSALDCKHCRIRSFARLRSGTLVAAASTTLYFSYDNGLSWTLSNQYLSNVNDIAAHPEELNTLILVDSTYGTKRYDILTEYFRFDSVYNFEYYAGYGHGDITVTPLGRSVSTGRKKRIVVRPRMDDNWTLKSLTPSSVGSFEMYNDSIGWIGTSNSAIFRTSDGGVTWLPPTKYVLRENGFRTNAMIARLAFRDSLRLFGTSSGLSGLAIYSDDGGETNKETLLGFTPNTIGPLIVHDSGYYLNYYYNFHSQDSIVSFSYLMFSETGNQWDTLRVHNASRPLGIVFPSHIVHCAAHGNRLFYNTTHYDGPDVLRYSDDNAKTWSLCQFDIPLGNVTAPAFVDDSLGFLMNHDNKNGTWTLLRTLNGGKTWSGTNTAERIDNIHRDKKSGDLVGIQSENRERNYVYTSTDEGMTWNKEVFSGVDDRRFLVVRLLRTPTQSYIQGSTKGFTNFIVRSVSNSGPNAVEQDDGVLPRALVPLRWHESFPNPFSKKITLRLWCHPLVFPNGVKLKAYNSLGTETADLTDAFRQGTRVDNIVSFEWQPDNIPAGVYYIKADCNGYSETTQAIHSEKK